MSKPLDKMLKNELVALVNQLQDQNHAQALELAQLRNDLALGCADIRPTTSELMDEIKSLREQLAALEERRRFESIAYRKKIRTQRAVSPGSVRGLGEAAKRYCEEHGVASCTPEQARTMLSS